MRGKASSLHRDGGEGMDGVRYETFRNAVLRIHPEAEEKDIKAAYTLAEGQRDVLSAALKRLRELKKEGEELGLVEVIPKVILTTITAQLVRKGLKKIEKEREEEEKEGKKKEKKGERKGEVKEKGEVKGEGMGGSKEGEDNRVGENKIKELIKDVQDYVKKIIHSKRACYLASVYAKKKLKDYNPVIVYGDVHKDGIKVKNHAWLIITVKGKRWIYDPTIKKFVEELPILMPLEEGKKYWRVKGLLEELRKGGKKEGEGVEEKYKGVSERREEQKVSETSEEDKAAILWL